MQFEDISGNKLNIGDRVVVPIGSPLELHIGTITKITSKSLKVETPEPPNLTEEQLDEWYDDNEVISGTWRPHQIYKIKDPK